MDTESKWLERREDHYLKHPNNCPICDSENIDAVGMMQHSDVKVNQCVICCDCRAEWGDVYTLTAVEIKSYPTDLVLGNLKNPNPNETFKR